ncbi:sensor histidine kinase [Streptomyces sp. NPDC086787]|uniref:sensor histidine kinase n=1 Tax=Streptomyces sp. NPDC086787 TaxID=3365759 RepID=UPI00381CC9F3
MRRTLAGIVLAVTLLTTLSFLVPLAVLARSQARDRAITAAEQRAGALAPVLTLTTDPDKVRRVMAGLDGGDGLAVRLPDGSSVGAFRAPDGDVRQVTRTHRTLALDVPGGWCYIQPVPLSKDRVAVVEAHVTDRELTRGVAVDWAVMSGLALGLVCGSVVIADRLASRVLRSSRGLSRAARALGAGDLMVRVEPDGPPELKEAGAAFNEMADRVVHLLAVERELVADLSHRLRTPLTALRLETERAAALPEVRRISDAVGQLEAELDAIITSARTPLSESPPDTRGAEDLSEVAELVGGRLDFWSVLAAQQGRDCTRSLTGEPTPVRLPGDDLAAVVDALIGNVFRHTPHGTAFSVSVERSAQAVLLTVDDAGPGIDDPAAALARGVSEGGSTGLGMDIADRAARRTGGRLSVSRSPLGGARIQVRFTLATAARGSGPRRRRRN